MLYVEKVSNLENTGLENKSEKILIVIALLMFATIIGYNAFFVPEVPQIIETQGAVSQSNTEDNQDSVGEQKFNGLVNINTAPEEEMIENLNGVGPAIAKRIVEYREQSGGFANIEELMNVKGIGEKVFAKLKDDITV